MKINVNVKRKFRINGKEYGSLEEMPEDVRAIVQKTMDDPGALSGVTHREPSKIVFNGVEYDSVDDMPTYARNLYEQAGNARAATQDTSAGQRRPGPKTIEAEPSFSARSIVAVIALIALLLLLYYLFSSR